jgi:hypothetical protein
LAELNVVECLGQTECRFSDVDQIFLRGGSFFPRGLLRGVGFENKWLFLLDSSGEETPFFASPFPLATVKLVVDLIKAYLVME